MTTTTVNGVTVPVIITPAHGSTPATTQTLPPGTTPTTVVGSDGVATITASPTSAAASDSPTAEKDNITILPGAPDNMSPMTQVGVVAGFAAIAVMGAVVGTRALDSVRRARADANVGYE